MTEPIDPILRSLPLWPGVLERQLENTSPGAHICAIHSTPTDRLRVLTAFLGGGLLQGDKCVYFAGPDQADELVESLRALGARARTELDRGALVLVTTREQFLRDGSFDPRLMHELQDALARRARTSGPSALRIAADMNWVLGPHFLSERFFEYEALVNATPPASGRSIVCQYDWRAPQAPDIRDVLRAHPVAIIGERVHDNLYYEPSGLVQADLQGGDAARARADWIVGRLEAPTRREIALFDLGRLVVEGTSHGNPMRAAPELIAAGMQLDFVQLFELLPAGDAIRLIGSTGPNQAGIDVVERVESDSIFANARLREGQPVIIYDRKDDNQPKLPTTLRHAGVTSSVGIVISLGRGERVYGFLSAHSLQPRIFSDAEFLFLENVGHLLAYAFAATRSSVSFGSLVENAPDVIVRFDADLRILYANRAIEQVTGAGAGSLIGKASVDLGIVEPLVPTWELLLRQVWRTGREQSYHLTIGTATGERVFDSRIVPELSPDGSVQSLLTISRDVTAQRRGDADRSALYQQLLAQQNQIQELLAHLAQDVAPQVGGGTISAWSPTPHAEHLTDRERHILRLIAAGWTNRQIGAEIGITVGTVKNQVARILSKMNVTDRTQAAVRAVSLGVVETPEPDAHTGP